MKFNYWKEWGILSFGIDLKLSLARLLKRLVVILILVSCTMLMYFPYVHAALSSNVPRQLHSPGMNLKHGELSSKRICTAPSLVQGLQLVQLDNKNGFIYLKWNVAKPSAQVDKYAIYYMPASYGDPPSGVEWDISHRNSVKISFKNASLIKFSEIDKFLAFDPGGGIFFWVLAHNKYGWGKNDIRTENPNETFQNYLKRLLIQGRNPPNFTFINLDYLLVSRPR